MGGAASRARPGVGPARIRSTKLGAGGKHAAELAAAASGQRGQGYFILCLKSCDKVKLVNASNSVVKQVTAIVRRHCNIVRCGWDRHYAYFYKLQPQASNRHSLIMLTAEILVALYRSGWEPMTPIDLSVKGKTQNQTAICFRRDSPEDEYVHGDVNSYSVQDPVAGMNENKECLCLETYGSNLLGFHDVPNTVLHDLVTCAEREWGPGIAGISQGIYSVISDYLVGVDYNVIPAEVFNDSRFLKFRGRPWAQAAGEEEGPEQRVNMASSGDQGEQDDDYNFDAENLVIAIVECLARAKYRLQISIQMDTTTTVFFFIRDASLKEVRLPTFCGVGLGEKNGMYVYKPTITRTKTSFFRSRAPRRDKAEAANADVANGEEERNANGGGNALTRGGKSIRKKIRASFRMKSTRKKASVTATPNAPELNTVTDPEAASGRKPRVLKDKRIRNLLTVAAVSDTDTDAEAEPESRPGTPGTPPGTPTAPPRGRLP